MGVAQAMEGNNARMTDFQKSFACLNRQLNMADNFSRGKDRFLFFSLFAGIGIPASLAAFYHTKNPARLIPVFILGFSWSYQYDMFYGNKMVRVRKEVERLLKEEPEKFYPPENNLIWTKYQYTNLKEDYNKNI